ncbi:MAG: (d)CMP kinase, partial [Firmicutes bacterium]|nr:(d)CMP kinase [Bacillota bacterium]
MYNIALDGTSGAGKSTVAKLLAKQLGIVYLDTGAMYRAVAIKLDKAGVGYKDEAKIGQILDSTKLDMIIDGGAQKVILDGVDVSQAIREHHVSKLASDYSAVPVVRQKMVRIQQSIAKKQSAILDGRDIGT